MCRLMKGVPRVAAVACAAAALVLCLVLPGGQANANAFSIVLRDLEVEEVFGSPEGQTIYEVSVRVERVAPSAPSVEIGFFFTEQRTRRHNLIGVATANLITEGDWVRPGVRWNTAGLNPGLYTLRAVDMSDPVNYVESDDYVNIILPDAGLVWPPQDPVVFVDLPEVLCSMDWSDMTVSGVLPKVWNLGAFEIMATDRGSSQLLVRGEVSLLDEEGAVSAIRTFDPQVPVFMLPPVLAPGASGGVNTTIDLTRFVREAITLYVDREKGAAGESVSLKLGDPLSIRTSMVFTTSDIEEKALARSLKSFRVFFPGSTDPLIGDDTVFSLYTDVEDFIFPRHETCSILPQEPGRTSPTLLPVTSWGATLNTYVVVENTGGHEVAVLGRGGTISWSRPVYARDAAGNETSTPAKIISDLAIGVGADPGTGFSRKPILFFCGDDGFLRAYVDSGTSFSPLWNPDGWTANAVKVPTGGDGAISPPAAVPRPQPHKAPDQQDLTEFVVVGSSEGLYVYRLTRGTTTGQALFRSYDGYRVLTEFAPFAIKRGNSRLVYFFARRAGEAAIRLYVVDVNTNASPSFLFTLAAQDEPSTELVAARSEELAEDTTYLFFGTKEGQVYVVNTAVGSVGQRSAVQLQDGRILGVRAVVRQDGSGYDVYANTEGNRRLFQMSVSATGTLQQQQQYGPPYSQQYLMDSSLEILPADGTRPGMIFLSYQGGPVVAVDLANPNELLLIDAWADVWTGTDARPAELKPAPFEFFGCALEGCGGFGPPVVARSFGRERRLLVRAGDGRIYAFDLTKSIIRRESNEGTTTPVSP